MGRLTTHVLDTARGRPAAGVAITLCRDGEVLVRAVTNDDGRTDRPLIEGRLTPGMFELTFAAGDYLRRAGLAGAEPLFLDLIPIRFGIADPDGHYHVPLLLSPFGYATYRGS